MNKEIILLIKICKTNKTGFQPEELAALINLKFKEGVYPYIRKLVEGHILLRQEKGAYALNESSEKVKAITK